MPIDTREIFCQALSHRAIANISSFQAFMDQCDELQRDKEPETSSSALANAHGRWFEWLLSLGYWQYLSTGAAKEYALIPLPNIRSFDAARLYEPSIFGFVEDLRIKVNEASGVSLITSNPDFVFIRLSGEKSSLRVSGSPPPTCSNQLAQISQVYESMIGSCALEDVVGYLSAKVSLRPDRRLQVAHEGSLTKAIFRHIQTRLWDFATPSPFYVLATPSFNKHDIQALNTVATHSLVTVDTRPEKAVDGVVCVDSGPAMLELFEKMQKFADERQPRNLHGMTGMDFVWLDKS